MRHMLSVIRHPYFLLADAEAREDGVEEGVGGYGAGDRAEMVDGFADILGDEIAGEARVKTLNGTLEGGETLYQGFVVPGVGDNDISFA